MSISSRGRDTEHESYALSRDKLVIVRFGFVANPTTRATSSCRIMFESNQVKNTFKQSSVYYPELGSLSVIWRLCLSGILVNLAFLFNLNKIHRNIYT